MDLPDKQPTVLTIHGNSATHLSFSFIKASLNHPKHLYTDFEYSSSNSFHSNLHEMAVKLSRIQGKVFILAHSLGGIYAGTLAVMFPEKVVGIVSMSTPYGGSEVASTLGLFFPSQLFSDIKPTSKPIRWLRRATIPCPLTAIVTTGGQSSIWPKLNDGVVSRESMYDRTDAEFTEVEQNHSEVLMSLEVVCIIRNAIYNAMEG